MRFPILKNARWGSAKKEAHIQRPGIADSQRSVAPAASASRLPHVRSPFQGEVPGVGRISALVLLERSAPHFRIQTPHTASQGLIEFILWRGVDGMNQGDLRAGRMPPYNPRTSFFAILAIRFRSSLPVPISPSGIDPTSSPHDLRHIAKALCRARQTERRLFRSSRTSSP